MAVNIAEQLLLRGRPAARDDDAAILCEGRRLSYTDLVVRVATAAARLRGGPDHSGARVLVRARDTEFLVIAILGAMRAGLVPVILSPRVSADDIRYVFDETGADFMIDDDSLGAATADDRRRMTVTELAACRLSEPAPGAGDAVDTPRAAFWLYSSGTTGRMKGVIHGHRDLAPVLAFHRDVLGIGPGVRTFCTSRLSFAFATANGFLAPLALGATVVLHPDWPTPESTLAVVENDRPDVVFSVPSMYRAWLDRPEALLAPMRAVRHFVSAGEALPIPIAERWQAMTGHAILDCYGCSETCFLVFASPAADPKPGSVGFPCPGVEAELRDEEGRPLTDGRAGRLFIRHPFLALGYGPAAPSDAHARFRGGWFATGDVFRRDDAGSWFHYGREDDWLKIAGQWVSLRGVEEAAGGCDGVAQAVAVTAGDANGFLRVALFVVPAATVDVDGDLDDRVAACLGACLPAFKRPKWIRVIDELPVTSTGKIRKAELRRRIEAEVR